MYEHYKDRQSDRQYQNALKAIGQEALISNRPEDIEKAKRIIFLNSCTQMKKAENLLWIQFMKLSGR